MSANFTTRCAARKRTGPPAERQSCLIIEASTIRKTGRTVRQLVAKRKMRVFVPCARNMNGGAPSRSGPRNDPGGGLCRRHGPAEHPERASLSEHKDAIARRVPMGLGCANASVSYRHCREIF